MHAKSFISRKKHFLLFGIIILTTAALICRNRNSAGFFFNYSRQVLFCGKCAALEVQRKFQVFGIRWDSIRCRDTLLKKTVFESVQHTKNHHEDFSGIIESFECSLSFENGYQSRGYGNYWTPDKTGTWGDTPPFPDCQIWTNQSHVGFCLHDDPSFVGAFKQLAQSDPAWSMHQLQNLRDLLSAKKFPGCLVDFKTNKNRLSIFKTLKMTDLGRADYDRYWGRDLLDYPVGGTNWPRQFKIEPVNPLYYLFPKTM